MFGFIIHETYLGSNSEKNTVTGKPIKTNERIYKPRVLGEWKHIYNPNNKRSQIDNHNIVHK